MWTFTLRRGIQRLACRAISASADLRRLRFVRGGGFRVRASAIPPSGIASSRRPARRSRRDVVAEVDDNAAALISDAGCGCGCRRRSVVQAAPIHQELRRKPARPARHPRRHHAQQRQHGHRVPQPGASSVVHIRFRPLSPPLFNPPAMNGPI